MKKLTTLSPEQEASIPEFREEWIRAGLSCAPADWDAAEAALRDAYKVAGLAEPRIFIRLASPLEGAWAAALLSNSKFGPAVRAQVRDQVWDQVRDQVGAQVRDQVGAQVRAQVRDQVWDQVRDQVGAQVRDQVWDQVRDQVRDQVWAQVRDQVWDQVQDQVWDQVRAAMYGQHDAGWLSFYDFFARGAGLAAAARLEPLARVARSCGWVWMFAGACVITDRPEVLRRDDEGRLHCENGPALRYRDGFSIYAWHGTRIPAEWIEDRASLTAVIALTWRNVEQRRAACEILGWEAILVDLDARVIDTDADPEIGQLVEVDIPEIGRERFLRVRCGTGRSFAIPVPPHMRTALDAQAWTWGLDQKTFVKPEIRT